MKTSYYKFHKHVNIRFRTDDKVFKKFVDENYHLFKTKAEISNVDLDITVHFDGKKPPRISHRISSNLFTNDNKILYCDERGFEIYAVEREKLLEINTYVSENLLKEILNFMLHRRKNALYEKYLLIMRNSIHLPLFYLLESKGFVILHGSAVSKNNVGYLFLGGNHIGKTTIALNLVYKHKLSFLTDDFILIKDNKLFAFPEKVRVKSDTLSILPIKPKGHLIHSKYHLVLPQEKLRMFTYPKKIFFVSNSENAIMQKMEVDMALKRLNAFHDNLHEFPRYSYLAFLPNYPINDTQGMYTNFLENKDIWNLLLSTNNVKNIELIMKELER